MTDKELYISKCEYMEQYFDEVSAKEFYREVFPVGELEREGHPEDGKANGILTVIRGDRAKNRIIFDELDEIDKIQGEEFAVTSCVAYSGRNRTAANARWLYGITIDLDGVELPQIRDLFFQAKNGFIPQPTFTINSGHGLHLYYLFKYPAPLYKHLQEQFRDFKYELISKIWNGYTSTYTERDQIQYQGIFQGFRMVGTQSKLGKDCPVRAWQTGPRYTVEDLNEYLIDESKAVTDFQYKSKLPLMEAKTKYPEWYEKRIENGEPKGRWHVKRDLYDWWKGKILTGASVGHRYSCLSVLATYAVKCDIDEDELYNDAMSFLNFLDDMTDDEHNHFTRRDVLDAMKLYQESYVYFSRKEAERVSGIQIPPNKRNGRRQEIHLKLARGQKTLLKELGEMKAEGRPKGSGTKAEAVKEWRSAHPDGTKAECIRDTGLSKPTVYRWWDDMQLTEEQKKLGAEIMTNPDGEKEVYYPVDVGEEDPVWYPASYMAYLNSKGLVE